MTRRAWIAFAAVSVLWGVPYLFIKYAEQGGLTPATIAWGRVTLAAVILLGQAWRGGTLASLRGHWRWLSAYAVFEIVIPFPMIAVGEQRVPSSLTAIIIATVPLIGTVLALRFDPGEKPTPLRALGLAAGFLGVIALVGIDIAGRSGELLGAGAIVLAAIGYAVGPMIVKQRLQELDAPTLMGGGLLISALLLAPLAAIDLPARVPTAGALAALAGLALLCTTLAFVVMIVLIREAGVSRAMVVTYVNPVIALALGVVLLGESPGAGALAGLTLIVAGSWLSTTGRIPGARGREALVPGPELAAAASAGAGGAAATASSVPPQRVTSESYERGVN